MKRLLFLIFLLSFSFAFGNQGDITFDGSGPGVASNYFGSFTVSGGSAFHVSGGAGQQIIWHVPSTNNSTCVLSWSFGCMQYGVNLKCTGSLSQVFNVYNTGLYITYPTRTWVVGLCETNSPPATNAPLSPTNLFFEVSGTFQNPYEFPVDLFYMFYDEDGNEVGSAFIHTVDGYENYGFSGTYRCLLNDEIDWLGSGFVWDSVGLDFKTVDGFSEANPDLVSIIDADSDGYFDAPYNGSWSWSSATNFYFGTYSAAQARSNTIAAAGSGAASRRVTNELDVAFTSPASGVAGAVNTLSGSSADVIQTAAGVAAGLGLAGLSGGSGGGTDMSGVIGGLGTLGGKVDAVGGKVDAVGGKVDDLYTLIEDTFNMGSVGDTTVVDPTEGLQDSSDIEGMTSSIESKHAGLMSFSQTLGNWFTWDFPAVSGRRYLFEFVVGRNWTVKFDLTPYSTLIEFFRTFIGFFLAIIFIISVFNITRKGIA